MLYLKGVKKGPDGGMRRQILIIAVNEVTVQYSTTASHSWYHIYLPIASLIRSVRPTDPCWLVRGLIQPLNKSMCERKARARGDPTDGETGRERENGDEWVKGCCCPRRLRLGFCCIIFVIGKAC